MFLLLLFTKLVSWRKINTFLRKCPGETKQLITPVAVFSRMGRQLCTGMRGSFQPEGVAGFVRNTHPDESIRGGTAVVMGE